MTTRQAARGPLLPRGAPSTPGAGSGPAGGGRTSRKQLAAACFHEAGHAVAAVLNGGRISVCEVCPQAAPGAQAGRTDCAGLADHLRPAVAYAGPYAEARAQFGEKAAHRQAHAVLARCTSDAAMLVQLGTRFDVRDNLPLERCWPQVRQLALRLYREGSIKHRNVTDALGVPLLGDFWCAERWKLRHAA